MSVQTKLSHETKEYVKQLRERQKGELHVFHFQEERVTVGVRYTPGHNAARVFVSLAGPSENKFRPKVGEYRVRMAFLEWKQGAGFNGIPYSMLPGFTPYDIAQCIAHTVGNVR